MNKEKSGTDSFLRGAKGEYLVVIQFLIVGIFIMTPVWQPFGIAEFEEYLTIPRTAVLIVCGATALLFGGLGSHNLKQYITPLPYPVDHNQLVRTGVYSFVRHPLYSSQLFIGFGWSCYALSLSHFLLLVFAFFFFSLKASKEERWLTQRHPKYQEYARKVKKFIPFIY
ncbi:isoprenylcysteine carboxylmethyltransferase family protein [Prosthecochloris sp.]|uniref:methyltransferase family protein n=1 Tax=Prosthecochloris sp. TaxID=290513 RepID=UPI00257CA6BD|nr:isoprenylcysteine carboxylmethyltransferase family protein [Prosthecochloris sp.]